MQRRAAEIAQYRPKSGLSKAFSSGNLKKGKNWDPREVFQVLTSWVANSGSPGVAEALISKLAAGGVELGSGQAKHKTGILSRRRSIDMMTVDRAKLLRLAVDGDQFDMVQLLLPHADASAIDAALPPAVRKGNEPIVELLVRYGAGVAAGPEGQDAFRQACIVHGQSHLISLLLRSDGRPPAELTSVSLSDAARAGCLETVLLLSRSTADGNYNRAEALKSAITLGRQDITLAIIMGNRPPQRPGLDEAFQMIYAHASVNPSTKLAICELLLCAGAQGEVVARALETACETQFYDMAQLLARYGASIEYNDATVLKTAIARGELDLISALLDESATLNPALASSCVPLIAKQAPFETRVMVLGLLLRKGASGITLDDMLIDAAEAGDIDSIDLLLSPIFPESQPTSPYDQKGIPAPVSKHVMRHEVASVDHKSGEALRTAVLRADALMTDKILTGQPTPETLAMVFPLTKKLAPADRYEMAKLFLKRSLSGPCLHAALHDAISEDISQRDDALIQLLLDHDADINFSQGPGLSSLIRQKDIGLLGMLLKKSSPQTAAARIDDAMQLADHKARFDILTMLINAGAVIGTQEIATALLQTLSEKPVDMSLLQLLLHQGGADINLLDGAIVKQAVSNPDPKVLELVFAHGRPSASTVSTTLNELVPLPSTEAKAWKIRVMLPKCKRKDDYNWILVHEVQSLLRDHADQVSLTTLKQVLDAGGDPNAYKAAALCHAVIGSNAKVVDMLFEDAKFPLSPESLGTALPHVLRIQEQKGRLALSKRLVRAGANPLEANRALVHAISTYPSDISLQSALASVADTSDGEALSLAVAKESPETLDLLLAKSQYEQDTRSTTLGKAMDVKNRTIRHRLCDSLLKAGVSTSMASSALLVAARDGDVKLGDLLMEHGASIANNDGQAIIEACRGGSAEVLKVLLKQDGNIKKSALESGFQAATEVRDLSKRAIVFDLLLRKGVTGELVDEQLESAARYGEDGQSLLRVLLVAGADPNFNNGESVVAATRSAFISSLELLLGLWDQGGSQVRKRHQSPVYFGPSRLTKMFP